MNETTVIVPSAPAKEAAHPGKVIYTDAMGHPPERRLPLRAALLIIVLASLQSCEPSPSDTADAGTPEPVDATSLAPRFPPCDPDATIQRVTFVHVNDLHGTFHPDGPQRASSPAARLRGYYLDVLGENPFTFFTNAGDDFEKGWLAELRSGGMATREAVRAMGFDVRVLGNHDFAWGPWETLMHSRDPSGVVLATNMVWRGPGAESFGAVDYVAFDVGCVRVGFFGLVHKPYNIQDHQYDGPYFPGFDNPRHDVVNVAREVISARRSQVDLLVLVSHLGLEEDEHLAEWAQGIDVILSGHSHHVLRTPVNAGGAIIIQGGAYARFVGRLDVNVDLKTRRRISRRFLLTENLPGALPVDPEVEAVVRSQIATHSPDWDTPVAEVSRDRGWREVAEVAARAARESHGADAALVDGWYVWNGWPRGSMTPQAILDTFRVERTPAGTAGYSSLHRVGITGQSLARLASRLDTQGWALALAAEPQPDATYTLLVQKHVAYNPDRYLPSGVTLLGLPEHLQETYEAVHAYARERAAACLALDAEVPAASCP